LPTDSCRRPGEGQGQAKQRHKKPPAGSGVILFHSALPSLWMEVPGRPEACKKTPPPLASHSFLNCLLRRPCPASSAQDRVALCIELIRRNTSGKPQLGVHRAGDNGKGHGADLIDLKIRSRFDFLPLAQHFLHGVQCGIRDLIDLNRRSSPDHSRQGRQRAKVCRAVCSRALLLIPKA